MLFKRIGTKRTKFVVNLYPKRLTITPVEQQYIKIQLQRGTHTCLTQKPQKIRKGVCIFPKLPLTFDCTMFLDPDTNKYLSKPAQLKIKQCDRQGTSASLKTITKLTFDLAEYANMQEPYLEIEFEFEKCDGKLEADIEFVISETAKTDQEEDKKSARSEETTRTDVEKKRKRMEEEGRGKGKGKKELGEIKEEDQAKMEKSIKKPKIAKKQDEDAVVQENKKYTKSVIQQTKNNSKESKTYSQFKPILRQNHEENEKPSKKYQQNGKPKQKQVNKQPDIPKFLPDTKSDIQSNLFNATKSQQPRPHKSSFDKKSKNGISQMSPLLLLKQIQQKNTQIQQLRHQNLNLKEVIEKIASQPLPTVRTDSFDKMERIENQNKLLKTKLAEKESEISAYEVTVKGMRDRDVKNTMLLKKVNKETEEIRQQLEKCRYKIANLLDKCFESGDTDLIEFVEQHLELE